MFLSNLKELRSDMRSKEKAVTVFRFKYKQQEYFVAVCLLTDEDRKKHAGMTEIMPVPRNSNITVLRPPSILSVIVLSPARNVQDLVFYATKNC